MSGFNHIAGSKGYHWVFNKHPHGKPGWELHVRLGKGAGYRWLDFPGYSMNMHAPWYRHLSISGRSLHIGTHMRESGTNRRVRLHVRLTSNGNSRPLIVPGWW